MCEQWWLHCTSQLGTLDTVEWACVLCGCHIQNSEQVEQQMYIKFSIKLEQSSTEAIQMIQKAADMGNWQLAASSGQCACSYIMYHAELFGKTSNYAGDSAPLQPRFDNLQLPVFPKLNSPLKRKRFQNIDEIRKYMTGQLIWIGNWENCMRSHTAYFEGGWGAIVLSTFLGLLYLLQYMSLYFILHSCTPSGQTSYIKIHYKNVN